MPKDGILKLWLLSDRSVSYRGRLLAAPALERVAAVSGEVVFADSDSTDPGYDGVALPHRADRRDQKAPPEAGGSTGALNNEAFISPPYLATSFTVCPPRRRVY